MRAIASTLVRVGIASAMLALGVGCTSTHLRLERSTDGATATGYAFVGDELIEYQAWSIQTFGGFLGLQGKGYGSVLARIDPKLEQLRIDTLTGYPEDSPIKTWYHSPYNNQKLESWNALGYKGWLLSGSAWWSNGLLPYLSRTDEWYDPAYKFRSEESFRYAHINLIDEATGAAETDLMMLIAIVPPVVARVERQCFADIWDRFMGMPSTLVRWDPEQDRDCVITGLWSLTRDPDAQRITGRRLIPEGTTMTLGEVLDKGPSLWREDLEAMRALVDPRPLKRR